VPLIVTGDPCLDAGMNDGLFLPGLPVDLIMAAYTAAPGNEIESGKFASPESSASLVANSFGYFLSDPQILPPLPGTESLGWPADTLGLEAFVRFPWSGGRHPCLDVLISTGGALIGIESKRYETFRSKSAGALSEAYWRPVWGEDMCGYEELRDELRDGKISFEHLDAVQLIKHAFGLRTAVQSGGAFSGKTPILYYIYAEPQAWPDGRVISDVSRVRHRHEIYIFKKRVEGCEVQFLSCSYDELFNSWRKSDNAMLRMHADAVADRYHL
jgi:hypothetical protein